MRVDPRIEREKQEMRDSPRMTKERIANAARAPYNPFQEKLRQERENVYLFPLSNIASPITHE